MWRGASTAMAERSHRPSMTGFFYTLAIWVTFIHRTDGIPWTQAKVNQLRRMCCAHMLPDCQNVVRKQSPEVKPLGKKNLPHAAFLLFYRHLAYF